MGDDADEYETKMEGSGVVLRPSRLPPGAAMPKPINAQMLWPQRAIFASRLISRKFQPAGALSAGWALSACGGNRIFLVSGFSRAGRAEQPRKSMQGKIMIAQ